MPFPSFFLDVSVWFALRNYHLPIPCGSSGAVGYFGLPSRILCKELDWHVTIADQKGYYALSLGNLDFDQKHIIESLT